MFKFLKKKTTNTVINNSSVPQHIAFICDGNRRWAENRGLPPLMGHRAGISNFENLVDWFIGRGVSTVTFFIFSTENWNRSKEEIDFLMNLFYTELKKNLKHAIEKNLRYRIIGSRDRLPKRLAEMCDKLEEKSAENTGGTVVFALNYGGQDEIIDAVNNAVAAGQTVTKETFESFLDTGDLLPIDFMVRTSNENRISNFLLWKLAYAELLFVPEHWPELVKSKKLWQSVLDEFAKRNRRFGGGKKKDYSGKKGKSK
ncbi:MAG: di-trans,poly-cis-decaprenylcistransferase [Alphaproteobacteria bacterium]|nr:di-trans,poly-cis-decaprenylcistransferase [Alphaproteobacteria bacterium]MBN2675377.1 di-trans,poly-cis-decaprenylcistransferase [Alphaproteobacteria bacterium]